MDINMYIPPQDTGTSRNGTKHSQVNSSFPASKVATKLTDKTKYRKNPKISDNRKFIVITLKV